MQPRPVQPSLLHLRPLCATPPVAKFIIIRLRHSLFAALSIVVVPLSLISRQHATHVVMGTSVSTLDPAAAGSAEGLLTT